MRRPTLEAVATRAGVSKSTVSRVVNGEPTVATDIRDLVMRAVNELGYIPNPAARSLVTRRTDSIAVIVSDPSAGLVSDDPMFSTVVRAASREFEAAGKQVMLMLAGSDDARVRARQFVAARHVDAVMIVSMHGADPCRRRSPPRASPSSPTAGPPPGWTYRGSTTTTPAGPPRRYGTCWNGDGAGSPRSPGRWTCPPPRTGSAPTARS